MANGKLVYDQGSKIKMQLQGAIVLLVQSLNQHLNQHQSRDCRLPTADQG